MTTPIVAIFGRALPTLAILAVSVPALAQDPSPEAPPEVIQAVSLDIDRDGRLDRAVLVKNPRSHQADLYIYLGVGTATPIPTHDFTSKSAASNAATLKPDVVKASIADTRALDVGHNGSGSLLIQSGCGGCSNDYDTKLTIVHRGGRFLVGGYTYTWETRDSRGQCDINYLSGKGITRPGLGKAKPLKGKFVPVELAAWPTDDRPKACR
jgi:hypothetical protein